MIVKLLTDWTAAIPAQWDFEVEFAPADSNFISAHDLPGSKFLALTGSLLKSTHPQALTMFAGMIKQGMAVAETAELKPESRT